MMGRNGRAIAACVASVFFMTACSATTKLSSRFVKDGRPSLSFDAAEATTQEVGQTKSVDNPILPAPRYLVESNAATVEVRDMALAAALRELRTSPSSSRYLAVASAYRRVNILDEAHEYLTEGMRRYPKDAALYEARAQVWRDWKFPQLGLADAHRAVYLSPKSASAHNTLGTILQSLGQRDAARQAFDRAASLESTAAYAMNNLCYLSLLEGKHDQARQECGRALAVQPNLSAARNNLALAHAASGEFDEAQAQFLSAGGASQAYFNLGLAYLSTGRYRDAESALRLAERDSAIRARAQRMLRLATALANSQEVN